MRVSNFFLTWTLLDRSCTLQLTLSPLLPPCFISDLWSGEHAFGFWPKDWKLCKAPSFPQCCDLGTTFISPSPPQADLLSTLAQNPCSVLFRFLCFVECLCLGLYFIKQLPNCSSVSPSHPGSVVAHRNLGWKRPSGLPLSPPGLSSCSGACLFLIGWYLQHFPIWKLTLSFLSIQPLLGLRTNGTIPNKKFFWSDCPH